MSYAIDVNILLYASDSASPHNARASEFLASCIRGDDLLCLGYIVLVCTVWEIENRGAAHPFG